MKLEDAERVAEKERIYFEKQSIAHTLELERLKKEASSAADYIKTLENLEPSNVYFSVLFVLMHVDANYFS
jgi:hypothetical protein